MHELSQPHHVRTRTLNYLVKVGHEMPAHLFRLLVKPGDHLQPLGNAALPRVSESLIEKKKINTRKIS